MNDARSIESWRIENVSPAPPNSTSCDAVNPRARTACTGMPATCAPRAPSGSVVVASGSGARPGGLSACSGDHLGRTRRGAGRRVDLVGVVQLDDLDRLEERRGGGGEAHHQHGADREVGHDQDAGRRRVAEQRAYVVDLGVVEAGGADHDVDAVLDAPGDVVERDRRLGEVERDLGAGLGDQVERVVDVDLGHDLDALGIVECPDRLRTHAPLGAQHRDPCHGAQPIGGCRWPGPPGRARRPRPRRTRSRAATGPAG